MGVRHALGSIDRHVLSGIAGLIRVGRHRRHRPVLGGVVLFTTLGVIAAVAALASTGGPAAPQQSRSQVGVRAGQSVPAYVSDARRALAGLSRSVPADRKVYALAAFTGYVAPARLAPLLAGVASHRVYTRVPSPPASGPVAELTVHSVPADVTAGMDGLAADRARVADDFERLADASGGDSRQRSQYLDERAAYRAEAAGYRRHCPCVFAGVVAGTPADLIRLSGRAGVRSVDPAPRLRSLAGAVFTPPLPEQTGAAIPPEAQSPVPSGTPGDSTPTVSPTTGPATPSESTSSPVPSAGPPSTAAPSAPGPSGPTGPTGTTKRPDPDRHRRPGPAS